MQQCCRALARFSNPVYTPAQAFVNRTEKKNAGIARGNAKHFSAPAIAGMRSGCEEGEKQYSMKRKKRDYQK